MSEIDWKVAFRAAYDAAGWTIVDLISATRLSPSAADKVLKGGGTGARPYQALRDSLPGFADLVDGKAAIVDGKLVPMSPERAVA